MQGEFRLRRTTVLLRNRRRERHPVSEEWLSYSFEVTSPASAQLALHWEKLKVAVKIEVDAAKTP